MQQNVLERLYPHLRFNHIRPQTRSLSEPPPVKIELPRVIQKPEVIQKPIEIQEIQQLPETIKDIPVKIDSPPINKKKKVKIVEDPKPIVEIQRTPAPEPKNNTIRTSQIPRKGEKGLQPKYTLDQKKDMYLNKLSRKSVKKAEIEVTKVNDVLEGVSHDSRLLIQEEKNIKQRLKLINTAKLFLYDSSIDVKQDTRTKVETGDLSRTPRSKDELSTETIETCGQSDSDSESSC